MKTKEVIKKLQEADPSGELECAIDGNTDIFEIFETPAYYDGCLEILERNYTCKYYNVTGGVITGEGSKINIKPLSIDDAIANDPDIPVKVVGYSKESIKRIEERIEYWRKEVKKIIKEVKEQNSCKKEVEKDLCFKCKNLSHEHRKQINHFCNKLQDFVGSNWTIDKKVKCKGCIYYTEKKEK